MAKDKYGRTLMTKSVSFTVDDLDLVKFIEGKAFSPLVKEALRYYMKKDDLSDEMKENILSFIKENTIVATGVQGDRKENKERNKKDSKKFMSSIMNMGNAAKK